MWLSVVVSACQHSVNYPLSLGEKKQKTTQFNWRWLREWKQKRNLPWGLSYPVYMTQRSIKRLFQTPVTEPTAPLVSGLIWSWASVLLIDLWAQHFLLPSVGCWELRPLTSHVSRPLFGMYTVREDKVGVSTLMSSEPHKTGHYVECSDELLHTLYAYAIYCDSICLQLINSLLKLVKASAIFCV